MATIKYKENGEWKELAIGGGGVSEDDALLLPIYAAELQANVPLTSEEIEANKIAYEAARKGVKALYYIHTVQLGDIKTLMTGTIVGTDVVMFQSSLGVATSSDPNSDICDTTIYAVMIASDGQSQGIDLSRNLATKEYVDAHIGGGGTICQLPTGLLDATEDNPYIFSSEEASAIEKAIANMNNTSFVLYEEIQEQFGGTSKRKITFDTSILATFPSDQSLLLLSAQSIAPKQTGSLEINFFPSTLSVKIGKEGESYKGVATERIIAYQE